jgi:excisionase family DNA binding protein
MRDKSFQLNKEKRALARTTYLRIQKLMSASTSDTKTEISLKLRKGNQELEISEKAVNLLTDLLKEAVGSVTLGKMESQKYISTQQAAEFLQVSRPYVVKLIEEGKLPHKKVGTHRRLLLEDVEKYKAKIEKKRKKQLDFLAKQAQDLNLGYDEW